MKECLTSEQIRAYLSGSLDDRDEFARFEEHLTGCATCRTELQTAVIPARLRMAASLGAGTVESCPPVESLIAFVDGKADAIDREVLESHLELCEPCAQDVAGMREMAAQLESIDAIVGVPSRQPFLEVLLSPFRTRPAVQLGALAFVVGLAGLFTYLGTSRANRDEIARIQSVLDSQNAEIRTLRGPESYEQWFAAYEQGMLPNRLNAKPDPPAR